MRAAGGEVLQYAGDSLLAAFGAAGAREDDAERAVRCGLALRGLGRVLAAEAHAATGRLDLRVGSFAASPSSNICMQKGHETAAVFAPDASTSSIRRWLMRVFGSSSIHA